MKAWICVLVFLLVSCSTVTIKPRGSKKYTSEPTYSKTFHHWAWGLVAGGEVNVKEVCGGKPVKQMQTQFEFVDSLLGIVTLGIYRPRTAKVWCGGKKKRRKKKA